MINFTEYVTPPTATVQHRQHLKNGGSYLPDNVKLALATWRAIARKHKPAEPLKGPVALVVRLTWPGKAGSVPKLKTTRPDGDNLLKGIKDAMTAEGWWSDDAQVADERIIRYKGGEFGVVQIEAMTVEE